VFNVLFSLLIPVRTIHPNRNSRVEADNGNAALSDTVDVALSGVYFEDYLTGSLTEVTTSWERYSCRTRAYSGAPSLYEAGTEVNSNCTFSSANTADELLAGAAFCQGFVKAVYYTVNHTTGAEAVFTSVSATVTLSDVPIADLPTSSNATTTTAVTVTQTFSIEFTSAVATNVNSDNGNLVKRYDSQHQSAFLAPCLTFSTQ
jgi:cytoskeletal protein RodZ